jgi:hypothetical protein
MGMEGIVALIKFPRGSIDQEYSYFTDIDGLNKGDVLVVPTNNSYSIGIFSRYSKSKIHIEKADKWIVEKVDIEAYEERIFLEDLNNG